MLDAGCGAGRFSIPIAQNGSRVTLLDISDGQLSLARQKIDIIMETPRLTLREFQRDDWREVHLYSTDEEVVRFMPWGPNSEEDTRAFVDRVLKEKDKNPRKEYHFTVIEKSSGTKSACEE